MSCLSPYPGHRTGPFQPGCSPAKGSLPEDVRCDSIREETVARRRASTPAGVGLRTNLQAFRMGIECCAVAGSQRSQCAQLPPDELSNIPSRSVKRSGASKPWRAFFPTCAASWRKGHPHTPAGLMGYCGLVAAGIVAAVATARLPVQASAQQTDLRASLSIDASLPAGEAVCRFAITGTASTDSTPMPLALPLPRGALKEGVVQLHAETPQQFALLTSPLDRSTTEDFLILLPDTTGQYSIDFELCFTIPPYDRLRSPREASARISDSVVDGYRVIRLPFSGAPSDRRLALSQHMELGAFDHVTASLTERCVQKGTIIHSVSPPGLGGMGSRIAVSGPFSLIASTDRLLTLELAQAAPEGNGVLPAAVSPEWYVALAAILAALTTATAAYRDRLCRHKYIFVGIFLLPLGANFGIRPYLGNAELRSILSACFISCYSATLALLLTLAYCILRFLTRRSRATRPGTTSPTEPPIAGGA